MSAQRISVRFWFEGMLDLEAFIPVFHEWIKAQDAPDLLIDVANYVHVPNGPGLMLVGHEGDFGLEERNGRFSFKYTRKRGWQGETLAERVQETLQITQWGVQKLTTNSDIQVAQDHVEVTLLDRLTYPNTEDVWQTAQADLATTFGNNLTRLSEDSRRPLTISIQAQPVTI